MDVENNLMVISSTDGSPLSFSSSQFSGYTQAKVKRSDFPENFAFGAATSAYQIEGAWHEGGKGMSIWDVFTQKEPGSIDGGGNGCVAIDHHKMFRDDVALMKKIGMNSYRFSIAWTRVLPGGRLCTGVSKDGIRFYSDLIDALLRAGIEPYVTIFHWDVPQCLEEDYGGFLSEKIVKDFCEFAELCFWEFGDRVKYWITLNEPYSFASMGYATGAWPPCRGKAPTTPHEHRRHSCMHRGAARTHTRRHENPGVEPYIVGHNLILSHAQAVDIYRRRYQETQGGKIGMTNCIQWFEPLTNSQEDRDAASRAFDFMLGWFVEPMVTGDYPESMIANVGDRLPKFTEKQEKLVKGSYDFLGINYYTAIYASNNPIPPKTDNYLTDSRCILSPDRNGVPIGAQAGSPWLHVVPWGLYKLMLDLKKRYNDPVIYITENGVDEKNDVSKTCLDALTDEMRVKYLQEHLYNLKQAMNHGVNVKGYFVWSLFDNFEWTDGYSVRFGIIYVDYVNGRYTRLPKSSAIWYKNFLAKKEVAAPAEKDVEKPDRRKRLKTG